MGHTGNNTKIAVGAFFAALGLLALAGITLHETVFLWFLAACAVAYVACVSEVIVRRRHRTLAASGIGSILFIAFGIAFLRQWGLAFTTDPEAMSTPVVTEHPDLYFYLAAAAGAATLLMLVAGAVLPGRRGRRATGHAPRRRPASAARGPVSRPAAARRAPSQNTPSQNTPSRNAPSRNAPPRPGPAPGGGRSAGGGRSVAGGGSLANGRSAAGPRAQAAKNQSDRVPAPRAASSGLKRPVSSTGGSAAAKSPAASSARPPARTSPRR